MEQNERLVRLEERNDSLRYDLNHARKELQELKKKLEDNYVTKTELVPIARLVYGVISIAGGALISGAMAFILKGGFGQ